MKYEVGDTVIFTDYPRQNAKGTIIEVDHEDDELPYRIKYANTDVNTWVAETNIFYRLDEYADPIPNLLDREVSNLPELFQFVGEVLIEYKEVAAGQMHKMLNAPNFVETFYDIFDYLNDGDFAGSLKYVPALKDAIRYEMDRGEREEMERLERIKQLRDELARLEGR